MREGEGPDPIDVAVGARMRIRRQAVRMSQSTLAEHLGITFQQVQKYERGANRISASMLVKAARALDCSGGSLLGDPGFDSPAPSPQDDAMQAELNALLAMPGAVDLLRGFARIPPGDARAGLLAIVRGLTPDPCSARLPIRQDPQESPARPA
ncbi:MAG TPA: helix-turn-helix domain-containing protein [Phenylobacterium sp.]|jgi:transcriptional regulator with XRE-family HTH domain|uniref:helix-turn-helix domain-containing protein n=1 Tax=Phenylobacterium sp. TaxID=1871053 RepID=UPI002B941334|nr:helix-turn-helix domain-containing protein [Phenylobacterium sp.]HXA41053.1 helix-turn-helix domain-containing protein [Phenylobacterium sp.]